MKKSKSGISLQVAPNGTFENTRTLFSIDISLLCSYAHLTQVLPVDNTTERPCEILCYAEFHRVNHRMTL